MTFISRLLTASAAAALISGAAFAETPAESTTAMADTSSQAAAAPATAEAAPAAKVVAKGDLMQTLRTSGQFTTLVKAIDATNLSALLKDNQNLTLFAPTDAAFAALPAGKLDALMEDKAALQKLVIHHIINLRVDSSKIQGAKGPVRTVASDSMELDGSGEMLKADNATIIQADVMATNGVLHVVDRVLMPQASTSAAAASEPAAS